MEIIGHLCPCRRPTMADEYSTNVVGNHPLISVLSQCDFFMFLARSSSVSSFLSLAIIKQFSKIEKLLPATVSANRSLISPAFLSRKIVGVGEMSSCFPLGSLLYSLWLFGSAGHFVHSALEAEAIAPVPIGQVDWISFWDG